MKIEGTKSDMTLVLALLALSLVANVYLTKKVFQPRPPAHPPLARGAAVPQFTAIRLGGAQETVSYDGKKTVLYVFTTTCPWCKRNIPNIKRLFDAKGSEYRFVGISLDAKGLDSYVAQHKLPFPVYTHLSTKTQDAYRLGGVPQTLVISEQGTVIQNWSGAYADAQQGEVEKFFGVTLPGLAPAPSDATADSQSRSTPRTRLEVFNQPQSRSRNVAGPGVVTTNPM